MEKDNLQLAKAAVHRAETSAHAAITPEQYQEANTKIKVARNDVATAYSSSSSREQSHLHLMRDRLDSAEHYLKSGRKIKYW